MYNCDLFYDLLNAVEKYSSETSRVFLLGDMNARTAIVNDFIINDNVCGPIFDSFNHIFGYLSDTNLPVRRNPDQSTNEFGLKLLNLCRSTGLRILNGRHKDGLASDYTFCGSRGMSVVDYLLAPYDFLHIIDQFIVCNFTSFSDHAPLHVRLRCILHDSQEPERNSGTSNTSYESYRWKEELKDQCYESLTLNSGSLSQIVFSDIEKSQDGIDNYVESKRAKTSDVSLSEFFEHFRNLVTNDGINVTVDTPESVSDTTYDELDQIIAQDEILKCISNLKRGKSHGIDENAFSAFVIMDLGDDDVFLTQNKFSQAFENEELVDYGFFSHHEGLDFLNLSEEETTVEKTDTDASNNSSIPETDSTSNCSDANGPEYRHKLPVTPEEISNLIESAIPQSTRCHYKWGYNVFSNCQKERRARPISDNLPIPVEAITQSITEMEPCIRDTALQYFLADAKRPMEMTTRQRPCTNCLWLYKDKSD
ncbi:unnamed protein product [Mytilus edulis]|uniref:Endonuclease/exonuclease/phosphatase domain-containing protein n=1 Tax=Mytilus edulis TaxID=6550 RepID=A0A8S3RY20_MYTED|nr:unnamed protein product [Mytilus edulis]